MFHGFVELDDTELFRFLVKNSSGTPVNADSLPTYRSYGPDGLMSNGTGTVSLADTGSVTGASNASPISVTSTAHGLSTGTRVTITGVSGNTAANGTFSVTATDSDTFTLDGSTGNGSYTSGGTWNVAGLYKFSLDVTGANGYETGVNYAIAVSGLISSAGWGDLLTFGVV